jgi:hypothetical protein
MRAPVEELGGESGGGVHEESGALATETAAHALHPHVDVLLVHVQRERHLQCNATRNTHTTRTYQRSTARDARTRSEQRERERDAHLLLHEGHALSRTVDQKAAVVLGFHQT